MNLCKYMPVRACVRASYTLCTQMEEMIFDSRLETSSLHVNILKLQRFSVFDDFEKKSTNNC